MSSKSDKIEASKVVEKNIEQTEPEKSLSTVQLAQP